MVRTVWLCDERRSSWSIHVCSYVYEALKKRTAQGALRRTGNAYQDHLTEHNLISPEYYPMMTFGLRIYIYYLLFTQRPKSHHRGVGAQERQGKREEGKTSEKSEEEKWDQGREGEAFYLNPSN